MIPASLNVIVDSWAAQAVMAIGHLMRPWIREGL